MSARGASAAVTGENIAAAENIYGNKRLRCTCAGLRGAVQTCILLGGTCPNGWSVLEKARRVMKNLRSIWGRLHTLHKMPTGIGEAYLGYF